MRNESLMSRILFALALLVSEACFAQSGKSPAATRAQMESAIAKFMAAGHVPGISVAAVLNGEYAWSGGFGMADLENFVPATSVTLYRLGSVSKPLTATAAMRLWQDGKVDLDAPVQKYCPAFPEKEWPITTREVLAHLAGIRHYRAESDDDPEVANIQHFASIDASLKLFAGDPLLVKPGTKFSYSTHGYTVAGCVIEGASGQKYTDYVRSSILLPAGMTHTRADDRYAIVPHRTRFYHKNKSGEVVNAEFLDSSYKIPGGGWLSSAEDLAQFEIAILNDSLLQRATRDVMWAPHRLADGGESSYGLGWGSIKNAQVPEFGHGGGQQGTSTFILLAPVQRDGVVVLINMDDSDAGSLARDLLNILLASPANSRQ